jgi:ferrous iron transport protein B
MIDVAHKNGDRIDTQKLSAALGCEVIETSAVKGTGLGELTACALRLARQQAPVRPQHAFDGEVEEALRQIESLAAQKIEGPGSRWYAIKLFERDSKVLERLRLDAQILQSIEALTAGCEQKLEDDAESIITNERYKYIARLVKSTVRKRSAGMTVSDRIDRVVTNRWLALPIFAGVMWLVYYFSISTVGSMATDWVNDSLFGEIIPPAVEGFLLSAGASEWLQSLILDGIIGGVGAVLGFLPQMLVLFFFLAILEDSGYMARIAFIMDRIFRRFGLSGKSFIPILVGTGCAVPGIMAARTIENEKDRMMTVIVTPFIPCGAKLPIIALIAGALFPDSTWVGPSAYFVGIGAIIISGIILKKTKLFAGDPAPFVMELPAYHIPGLKGVLIHMWDRGKSFVKKAGTIIFVACGLIWFLSSFNWSLEMVDAGESMLASVGGVLAPLFAPLGWGDWKAAVAAVTGLVAKENVVGTFAVLYGLAEVAEDGAEIWPLLAADFTRVSAYSFLVFNLLCAPCFAAIGAIKREMGSWKWTLIAIGYQTGFAYAVAFIVYQLGSAWLLGTGVNFGTVLAAALLAAMLWLLFRTYEPVKAKRAPVAAGAKA